jgi:hypothetical protein
MRTVLLRRSFAAAAVLCALAVSSERAEAQTATTMYGCYVPLTGTVYRIRETNLKQACTTGHVEFSWNAQGPAGPPGSDGAPGQTGPQGPPGPAGSGGGTGWEIVRPADIVVPTGTFLDRTTECPAGKVPVSGGMNGVNPGGLVFNYFMLDVRHSNPVIGTAGAPSGWRIVALNFGTSPRVVSVHVICVNP